MKVAVLEWICGGGLVDEPPEQIPAGLRAEGWAMLCTLVDGLRGGGVEVAVAIDPRLISPPNLARLANQASIETVSDAVGCELPAIWSRLSQACDLTLVIAPEIDHALLHITETLRGQGAHLINCSADFIAVASDKLATARILHAQSVHHPPTRRLADIDANWLNATRTSAAFGDAALPWVVKPSDGAGGDGQRLWDEQQLLRMQSQIAKQASGQSALKKMLVQPWLRGSSYSCSAIVDAEGACHWLPIVSQDFTKAEDLTQPPKYVGCSIAAAENRIEVPMDLLNATVTALGGGAHGWIGVDLLYCGESDKWCVIEVNPRCTTSMVGLAQAYSGNLMMEMLEAAERGLDRLAGDWTGPSTFRI
jgi:predicted ATP-grasp superfamily ATP-dependent carboligase